MKTTSKKKVFIVVTIQTHYRVLLNVARLLATTSRYEPILVYYPSAVFEQDYAGCQREPYAAWIYKFGAFHEKAACLSIKNLELLEADVHAPVSVSVVIETKLMQMMPNKGLYRKLVRSYPVLPKPIVVAGLIRAVITQSVAAVSTLVRAFTGLRVAISCLRFLVAERWLHSGSMLSQDNLRRAILKYFADEWAKSGESQGHEAGTLKQFKDRIREGLISGLAEQKRFMKSLEVLLDAECPALVILPEENLFYNSQFIVHAAHTRGIQVVIVPFTIVNTLEWAEAFYDVPLYHADNGWNRILAKVFPNWVLVHRGRRLILPPLYVLGCEYFGIVPDNPWLINSGHADMIASESKFMSEYYQRAGICKDKIHLTGALSDDKLFRMLKERKEQRAALGQRMGSDIKDRVLLVGLPPDQFGAGKRKGCEFDNYHALISFMLATIRQNAGLSTTVLVNPHPRISAAVIEQLKEAGEIIVQEPIETLVPLADVYVAVASATIRLAISCGIPVVNFDAYQYDYDDYKGLAGVCEVKLKHDYERVIGALIHDEAFYAEVQKAQRDTARKMSVLDGRAGERMLALFDRVTAHARPS